MTSTAPDSNNARATHRLAWTRTALREPALELERASTDAGFRSYWRTVGVEPTRIIMDSPPDKEDVRPWLHLHDLLDAGGVRVPQVLARDVDAGFLLLEDLGRDTYLQVIDADNADALFDAALDQLLRIQRIAPPATLPAYDAALLRRELHLFDEWFCEKHLGLTLTDAERVTLDAAFRFLIDAALAQPQVLVHRDFMPRNLMPAADGPAVLDFQDAVRGPIAYDPLSLFKDAFLSWPEARVADWLDRYQSRAHAAGLQVPERARFRDDADLIGAQRHLKVIGIFARLNHRDGKPKYLADVPRFFDYLADVLPRYDELDGLRRLLDVRVLPAVAATATHPAA